MPQITKNGLSEAKKKLEALKKKLDEVQEQKRIAYETGGNEWHDNAAWEQSVLEEQMVLGEIAKLEGAIKSSDIVEESSGGEVVRIGSTVTLLLNNKQITYKIVGELEANPASAAISYRSPLGVAVFGAKVGEKRSYQTPKGFVEVLIVKID